jgi:hypothetical protein
MAMPAGRVGAQSEVLQQKKVALNDGESLVSEVLDVYISIK